MKSINQNNEAAGIGSGLVSMQNSKDGGQVNQMFYGDYHCDDEPEDDDQSQQQMSGSQFSDDLDDRVDDEEDESEADSPVRHTETNIDNGSKK